MKLFHVVKKYFFIVVRGISHEMPRALIAFSPTPPTINGIKRGTQMVLHGYGSPLHPNRLSYETFTR